jgi:RNA polymerase sigma-70 factor (ECF subfamily)
VSRPEILALLRERIVAFAASRNAGEAAEDVAQETLLVLHEKYGQVEAIEELVPLALQIVRYKLMSLKQKSWRRGETGALQVDEIPIADPAEDQAALLERKERLQLLAAAMAALGDKCKELFRLKLEGKTFSELQSILHADSINTVYTWDYRCRKQLLEKMGGKWEVSNGER